MFRDFINAGKGGCLSSCLSRCLVSKCQVAGSFITLNMACREVHVTKKKYKTEMHFFTNPFNYKAQPRLSKIIP